MSDREPPGRVTQFGDDLRAVEDDNEKLNRRLDAQDKKLLQIETQGRLSIKQNDSQSKEVLTVKQTTARLEMKVDQLAEKTKDFIDGVDYAKKTFVLLEWAFKRLLPLAGAVAALLAGIGWLKH